MVQKRTPDEAPYRLYEMVKHPGGVCYVPRGDFHTVGECLARAQGVFGRGRFVVAGPKGNVAYLRLMGEHGGIEGILKSRGGGMAA